MIVITFKLLLQIGHMYYNFNGSVEGVPVAILLWAL
jgi:hypothetical protein